MVQLKYTLCFIQRGNQLLMLNRNFAPNMGLWNGVGGKLQKAEAPLAGILREAYEETGIRLDNIRFSGTVAWIADEGDNSGIYVYIAKVPDDYDFPTPITMSEGILEWKDISWVIDPDNLGVITNIPIFLPKMLSEDKPLDYCFTYKGSEIINFTESVCLLE